VKHLILQTAFNPLRQPPPPRGPLQDGICWVYRYYSWGPAAIEWLPDGSPVAPEARSGGGKGGGGGGGGAGQEPEGASWTWYYPSHYAPLMQVGGGGRGAAGVRGPPAAAAHGAGRPRLAFLEARPAPRGRR
jgi:hypothetical protein